MQLPIEKWIHERYTSTNINSLFGEAAICYKNGAYRASLLLSYMGFLTIVKETILHSKPATGFTDGEWNSLRKKVNNHESWEEAVTNALQQGSKPSVKPIFRLSKDILDQILYWRSRRNDAAHFKENEIGGHHTEALWSFIKSNVPKMAVDGGMVGLLNKFADHFDDEKTPPGTDFRPLVREIPASVLESELPEFFEELPKVIWGRFSFGASDAKDVFHEVFNLPDSKVVHALTAYLKQANRDLKFLEIYPARLSQLGYKASEIRQIWKTRLFEVDGFNPFTVFAQLVRENLIPANELDGVHARLFGRYDQRSRRILPENDADVQALIQSGFYTYVHNRVIVDEKLKWVKDVNAKCDLIVSMIENCPLQEDTVEAVCNLGNEDYRANWLIDALERLFGEKEVIKNQFKKIADRKGLLIPTKLI